MGIGVIIYGKSGSGKSRSLKGFKDNEILYVNVEGKPLPFRNKFSNVLYSTNANEIVRELKAMQGKGIKIAVIDDAGYLMTEYFMHHRRGLKGNQVYDLYNDIGDIMFSVLSAARSLPKDTIVYYTFHEDKNEYGDIALKTIGKLLDRQVCIEGMYTIALRCTCENGEHFFKTRSEGDDITKSPEEMFDKDEIENDLKAVDTTIREYYGI